MSLLSMIQDVTDQVGLPRPTAVIGTSDTQIRQLLALANQEGRELARRGYWEDLTKEQTITTTATEEQSNALPSDYDRMIEGSFWNRTQSRKVAGPIDPQRWQALKTNLFNSVWDSFRIRGNAVLCYPVPTAGETWAFEYMSLNWLTNAAGDTEYAAWQADDDVGKLCESLMGLGVVWRFLKAKGMDYSEAYRTYEMELQQRLSNDGGMRILDLGMDQGGSAVFDPFTPEGSWTI